MTKVYRDSDFEIDLGVDNAHTRIIRLVGERKNVLELGCATGYMSKILVQHNSCEVVGVEIDAKAAKKAREVCSKVIIGDLELLDYDKELEDRRFGVIVCADVLEHLRDPQSVLCRLRKFLTEDGILIASIPNIAHISVVAELIEGRFSYRPEGLLDESHLRFFTLDSIYELLEECGFAINHLERFRLEPEETELRTDLTDLPNELIERLRSAPESLTYQFILSARPSADKIATLKNGIPRDRSKTATKRTRPRPSSSKHESQADPWHGLTEAVFGRLHHLEESRRRLLLQQGRLNERLASLQQHVRFLTTMSHQREASISQLESEKMEKDASIAKLEGELEKRDTSIVNLEAALEESKTTISQQEALISRLDEELRIREASVASLKTGIQERNQSLIKITQELQELHASFAATENQVYHLQQELAATSGQLSLVLNSRSWKVASRLRRVFVSVCPPGSRRERFFRSITATGKVEGSNEDPS